MHKKMRRFLLTVILLGAGVFGWAQSQGSLTLDQDARVDKLMKRQREVYAESATRNGYRVQIFMEIGNEAIAHAEAMKKQFTERFPELPIYLSYEQPYYRLRVGDFRNRVEAAKYLRLIKPEFNLAFVTADIINPPSKVVIEENQVNDGEENEGNYKE